MDALELIIGVVFVFGHSIVRFNQRFSEPCKAWAMTTKARYAVGAGAYGCSITLIYLLLIGIPGWMPKESLSGWPPAFSKPQLLGALLMTLLLPRVRGLKMADRWLRDFFQRRANIPYEMRRLSAELKQGRAYNIPEELQQRVRDHLEEKGFKANEVVFEEGNKPQHLLTRIAVLILQMDEWNKDPAFSLFLSDNQIQHQLLRNRFAAIRGDMLTLRRNGKPTKDSRAETWQNAVLDEANKLLSDICDFISQAVLQSAWRRSTRESQLRKLGFQAVTSDTAKPLGPVIWDNLISLTGSLFLLVFTAFVVVSYVRSEGPGQMLRKLLVMTLLIPLTQMIGVLAAIWPRQRVNFQPRLPHDPPRNLIYLIIAGGAYAIAFAVTVPAMFLLGERFDNADTWARIAVWSLLVPATVWSTAYNIDRTAQWSRWVDGLINVGLLWIAMFIVCVILGAEDTSQVISRFLIVGVIGFCIGSWIPRKYRESMASPTNSAGAAAPAPGMAVPNMVMPQPVPFVAAARNGRALYLKWEHVPDEDDAEELLPHVA